MCSYALPFVKFRIILYENMGAIDRIKSNEWNSNIGG